MVCDLANLRKNLGRNYNFVENEAQQIYLANLQKVRNRRSVADNNHLLRFDSKIFNVLQNIFRFNMNINISPSQFFLKRNLV